ncbi:MAG: hypothetical protein AAB733_02565, partial [Patescibacteria group bacterium]
SEEIYFLIILTGVVVASFQRFEWGVLFLMGELFIGHFGRLFTLDIGSFELTLRMAIFGVVLAAWVIQILSHGTTIHRSRVFSWIAVISGVIVWGVFRGWISGYPLAQIFADVNNYFYAFVAVFIYEAARCEHFFRRLFQIFTAAVLVMGTQTLLLLYLFTHQFSQWKAPLYHWTRRSGTGFIFAPEGLGGFHRIFFEGQIYMLVAFFLSAGVLIFWPNRKIVYHSITRLFFCREPDRENEAILDLRSFQKIWLLGWGSLTVILISMSRSFWLGGLFATIAMLIFLFTLLRWSVSRLARLCGVLFLGGIASLLAITLIVKIPFPTSDITAGVSTVDIFSKRTQNFKTEEASVSRFKLLDPLIARIREHPVLGSGFGTPVTYATRDARALANNPDGNYTTTTFEWGYLDTMTEVGVVGLSIFLLFYAWIARCAWRIFRSQSVSPMDRALAAGGALALLAVMATNVTTPYLNHPLGWGIVVWLMVYFNHNLSISYDQSHAS